MSSNNDDLVLTDRRFQARCVALQVAASEYGPILGRYGSKARLREGLQGEVVDRATELTNWLLREPGEPS